MTASGSFQHPNSSNDVQARDIRDALLKGDTIKETMADVYDHIQEREARKDRSAVLTRRPKPNPSGDTIEETDVWGRRPDKSGPGVPRDRGGPRDRGILGGWGVLWDGAKVKPTWGRAPRMPLAPSLDQVRGHPQITESPVNQRPTVNPLAARPPIDPFGPPASSETPSAMPGWGGALRQVAQTRGQMPGSVPGPGSGAPIAPVIPRGQRFNPGSPVPSPIIPRGQRFNPGAPAPSPIDPTASGGQFPADAKVPRAGKGTSRAFLNSNAAG